MKSICGLSYSCWMLQALSSGYLPIGAVIVSPEISEVIHSESNKLGMFIRSHWHVMMSLLLCLIFLCSRFFFARIYLFWAPSIMCGCNWSTKNLQVCSFRNRLFNILLAPSFSPYLSHATLIEAFYQAECSLLLWSIYVVQGLWYG